MTSTVKSSGQDIAGAVVPVGNASVQVSYLAGTPDYQEDAYMLAQDVPVPAGQERAFVEKSIRAAVEDTKEFMHGGATVAAVLFNPADRTLHAAGLGDCELCLYIRNRETGDLTAIPVLREHSLNNKEERNRILGSAVPDPSQPFIKGDNGMIMQFKNEDGAVIKEKLIDEKTAATLAVTRACGDSAMKGVSHDLDPQKDIVTINLNQWPADKFDVHPVLSSDGGAKTSEVDKALSLTARVNHLQRVLDGNPGANVAETLNNYALGEGSYDNCTAIGFNASQKMDGNLFLVVTDGHPQKSPYGLPVGRNPAEVVAESMERSAMQGMRPAATLIMDKRQETAPAALRTKPAPTIPM